MIRNDKNYEGYSRSQQIVRRNRKAVGHKPPVVSYNKDNMMNKEEFIKKEIMIWGEDYIFDLMDRGYSPIILPNGKWSWLLSPNIPLRTEN